MEELISVAGICFLLMNLYCMVISILKSDTDVFIMLVIVDLFIVYLAVFVLLCVCYAKMLISMIV